LGELRLGHRAGANRLRCTEGLLLLLLLLLLEKLSLLRQLLLLLLLLLEKLCLLRLLLLLLLGQEVSRERINLTVLVVISRESFQGNLLSGQLRHWNLAWLLGPLLELLDLLRVLLELLRVLLELLDLLRVLLELLRVLSKLLVLLELGLELTWLLLLGELGLSLGLGSLLELESRVWLLRLRSKLSLLVLLELLRVLLELLWVLLELLRVLLELLWVLLELLWVLLELLRVLLELLGVLLELLLSLKVSEVLVEVARVELFGSRTVWVEVSCVEHRSSGSLSAVSKVLSLGRGVIFTSDLLLFLDHRLLEGDDSLMPLFLKLESRVGLLRGSLSERIDLDQLEV